MRSRRTDRNPGHDGEKVQSFRLVGIGVHSQFDVLEARKCSIRYHKLILFISSVLPRQGKTSKFDKIVRREICNVASKGVQLCGADIAPGNSYLLALMNKVSSA